MSNATQTNKTIQHYQSQLPSNLQNLYAKITEERKRIYYYGYALGLVLSAIVIYYNNNTSRIKMTNTTMVCVTITISFLTNYFYYMLSPKSTYMLQHINSPEQTKAWLAMYKAMQYYWHAGLVLGIVAVAFLAIAFRC
jgi:UDP-N-acetylmuramyl pentapeptide phosphotransferase/UDP-N-acetylglucosamine-1-phosphate transferase